MTYRPVLPATTDDVMWHYDVDEELLISVPLAAVHTAGTALTMALICPIDFVCSNDQKARENVRYDKKSWN